MSNKKKLKKKKLKKKKFIIDNEVRIDSYRERIGIKLNDLKDKYLDFDWSKYSFQSLADKCRINDIPVVDLLFDFYGNHLKMADKKGEAKIDNTVQILNKESIFNILISPHKDSYSKRIEISQKDWKDSVTDKIHYLYIDFDWANYSFQKLLDKCRINNAVAIGLNIPYMEWYFGLSTERLVNIGYNEIKELINKGVPSKNIIIDGLCLTSAIGIKVAEKLLKEGIVVNLFSDRSPGSMENIAYNAECERQHYKNIENTARKTWKLLFTKFLDTVVVPLDGSKLYDVGEAFAKLYKANPNRINYITYRAAKDENGIREPDQIIAHANSIHKTSELKELRVAAKEPVKYSIKLIEYFKEKHRADFSSRDISYIIRKLRRNLEKYRELKFQEKSLQELNIQLFEDAIEHIEKYRGFDASKIKDSNLDNEFNHTLDYVIDTYKSIHFFMNSNHKVEKIYPNEGYKEIKLRKEVDGKYDNIFYNDRERVHFEREVQHLLQEGAQNKFHIPNGHVIGRHLLYSRLYNSTVESNLIINQGKVKPYIKKLNSGEEVNGRFSLVGCFINDIIELNNKEKTSHNTEKKDLTYTM